VTVIAVITAAVTLASRDRPDPRRPNIILILVDTLRRDHVGAYGYNRPTTPTIDAFAADVTFANAYANSNWTKPSVASLLTGLYVSQHGVTHVLTSLAGQPPMTQKLPDEVTTLAEALKAKGYSTLAVVDNVHISAKLGFSQGFDVWDENNHAATVVTNDVLYRLDQLKGPFFLYVHYFDAHAPYNATRLFDGRAQVQPDRMATQEISKDQWWSTYTYGVDRGIIGLSPVERDCLVDLYDGNVRSVDTGIARIVKTLQNKDLFGNSWIIVTADHGENFYEDRRLTHPHDCFANPQMRVPLVMKMPDALAVRDVTVGEPVELVDIAPTILGYVGAAVPAGMVGLNLLPAILDRQPLAIRAVPAESESGRMLLAEGLKYVIVPTKAGDFQFVYDERRDPLEEHNLSASDPQVVAKMRSQFDELASDARRRQTVNGVSGVGLSKEEVERMRALGYIH
jgi:choline-sulfatase